MKTLKQWLGENGITRAQLQGIIGTASPDCSEAKIICDFAAFAFESMDKEPFNAAQFDADLAENDE
jgi:hypothetical protein